jgi:hypothetical protein
MFLPDRNTIEFTNYTTNLIDISDGWYLEWTLPQLKNFYVETLLDREIGHHIDCYRQRWTPATHGIAEEYADRYAFDRKSKRRFTYSRTCDGLKS